MEIPIDDNWSFVFYNTFDEYNVPESRFIAMFYDHDDAVDFIRNQKYTDDYDILDKSDYLYEIGEK